MQLHTSVEILGFTATAPPWEGNILWMLKTNPSALWTFSIGIQQGPGIMLQ